MKIGQSKELKGYQKEYFNENDPDWRETSLNYRVTDDVLSGSWRGSLFVMVCVLLTCVDVAGVMHWWGITIEITSMNIVIISVGLCVDFCAHIMHGFLTTPGSRSKYI